MFERAQNCIPKKTSLDVATTPKQLIQPIFTLIHLRVLITVFYWLRECDNWQVLNWLNVYNLIYFKYSNYIEIDIYNNTVWAIIRAEPAKTIKL